MKSFMNLRSALALSLLLSALPVTFAGDGGGSDWGVLRRPLSKVEALNLAIEHNSTILQARKEVEAATGVSIQTKAILYPKAAFVAAYSVRQDSTIEANQNVKTEPVEITLPGLGDLSFGGEDAAKVNNQAWGMEIQLTQSLYEGGRLISAGKTARLINEQAALIFEGVVADTLLGVSTAYDDVISAAKQVEVRAASVTFLDAYLAQTKVKAGAGAITEFEVLRQEVELANAQAALTQAQGDHRVAKQAFVFQLGYDVPITASDDLALNLTTPLSAKGYPFELDDALRRAAGNRTEIAALAKEELLRDEAVVIAKAGLKPSVQAFAGYEVTSRARTRNVGDELHGASVGVQVQWPIFDGFLTKGRVMEAVAQKGKASEAKAETTRIVERQVRTAWSNLRTAKAILTAQGKNVEKAVRALELANTRYKEGAGTQIDVLNAQTALTDARGSLVRGLRDYSVARASLLRATGDDLQAATVSSAPKPKAKGKRK